MTKQDFELIANVIMEERDAHKRGVINSAKEAHDNVALNFAGKLACVNPRFDRARFLRACGVED